ncbi:hypothetical protein HPB49_019301 [Dermacentor silvarum]|uniref:Uncharacterized protein n=1 Tax=Dermacentor silvarum TaxID=543639 RepID=A0ACB8D7W7_DERSI|nr:hypothetical protein HPB49_019301 [Dermacentor silvarum]
MPVVLYNVVGSPPCSFIRSLAKEIGIEITLKNIRLKNGDHLAEEFLKLNPFHRVPMMDDNGFVIYESNAIAFYLLRKYAPTCKLYPDCIKTRARIDQVLAAVSGNIHPNVATFFRPRLLQQSKPTTEEMNHFEQNVINGLEHLIGEAKFAVGDEYTIADLCLVGEVLVALENDSVDEKKFPKLTSYYERVKATLPYFEEIYAPNIDVIKRMWSQLNCRWSIQEENKKWNGAESETSSRPRSVNPFHKVPAIDDDGFVVYESNAIAYYLLRKYAPESDLYPTCIKTRTRIDQVLAAASSNIHPQLGAFFRPRYFQGTKPSSEEMKAFEENVLKNLENIVGDSKFAVGDKLTAADLCLIGHVTVGLECPCVDRVKYPKLSAYYERVKSVLPYYEEIFGPFTVQAKHLWEKLK